jgi:DNA helicase-2/ATP-dependent DNA helicase PcrA
MTLHAAKGLEFPVVFITGMEEEFCPLLRDDGDPDALEEERRLCYVGMTRAMEELYLTRARRRRRWGNVLDRLPSRFLGELPVDILETTDQMRIMTGAVDRERTRTAVAGRRQTGADDGMPAYEDEDQSAGGVYRPGQDVEHPTLGTGRILEVSGHGENTRLIVAFTEAGTRRLMARYSKLKVI